MWVGRFPMIAKDRRGSFDKKAIKPLLFGWDLFSSFWWIGGRLPQIFRVSCELFFRNGIYNGGAGRLCVTRAGELTGTKRYDKLKGTGLWWLPFLSLFSLLPR